MEKRIYKVAVLEDTADDYEVLKQSVQDAVDINIVYHEIDVNAFIDFMMEHIEEIDVALIDIQLRQDMNGFDAINQLTSLIESEGLDDISLKFIVFTKYDDVAYLAKAIQMGAMGFLLKIPPLRKDPATGRMVVDPNFHIDYGRAIRTVANGYTCIDTIMIKRLVQEYGKFVSFSSGTGHRQEFTRKQIEIMSLRIEFGEFTNGEVAYALGLKEQTIRGHMVAIHKQLNVNNYQDAIEQWKKQSYDTVPLRPEIRRRADDVLQRRNTGS